jgi:hypothetical protein
VYEYSSAESSQIGKETGNTWEVEAFGDQGDNAFRTNIRNMIVAKADALWNAGAIDRQGWSWMVRGANAGLMAAPGMTDAIRVDAFAKTAYYRMMNDTSLWALKQEVRRLVKNQVLADAKVMAANVALWDAIGTTMEYVSGAKALDKLNEYIGNIKRDVQATKEALAEARATLNDDRFALVAAEAKGIDGSIANLTKWVPGATSETGTTGMGVVAAVVAVAAGVAIGIAAICWAYVAARKSAVAMKLAEMAEAQRQDEVAAAEAKRYAADAAVEAAVEAGQMTEAQGEALKLQSADEAQVAVRAAGDKAAVAANKAAEVGKSAGAGFLGIDFKWLAVGGIALVGLMALPQIMSAIPKKRE